MNNANWFLTYDGLYPQTYNWYFDGVMAVTEREIENARKQYNCRNVFDSLNQYYADRASVNHRYWTSRILSETGVSLNTHDLQIESANQISASYEFRRFWSPDPLIFKIPSRVESSERKQTVRGITFKMLDKTEIEFGTTNVIKIGLDEYDLIFSLASSTIDLLDGTCFDVVRGIYGIDARVVDEFSRCQNWTRWLYYMHALCVEGNHDKVHGTVDATGSSDAAEYKESTEYVNHPSGTVNREAHAAQVHLKNRKYMRDNPDPDPRKSGFVRSNIDRHCLNIIARGIKEAEQMLKEKYGDSSCSESRKHRVMRDYLYTAILKPIAPRLNVIDANIEALIGDMSENMCSSLSLAREFCKGFNDNITRNEYNFRYGNEWISDSEMTIRYAQNLSLDR